MKRATLVVVVVFVAALAAAAGAQEPPRTDGWVVLPVGDYRALRVKAFPPAPAPDPPPLDATLTRIDYELRSDGEAIAGRALLTIDVLKQGWARVQIPSGLMVRDATLDGRPVPLADGAPPQVLLSRPGRAVLALDLVVPVTSSAGAESIALPPAPASVSRVQLALPRGGVELSVGGGLIAERAESASESRWVVFGRPSQPLTFSWKRRADDRRASQPLRLRARVSSLVALGEESSLVTASVRVEVVQGLARQVMIAVPEAVAVSQVTGAMVGDWEQTSGSLRVTLLDPASTDTSFVVHGEMRAPRDGAIAVPIVRVPSAERETGGVAVDVLGAGEIGSRQPRGLEPADPSELGDVVGGRESPSMIAFRFKPLAGADARSLGVSVVRYASQAVLVANVEEARYRALATEDGRLLVEARYAVRNNQRSFLKVTLPPDATLWSASIAGRPVRPGVAGADAILLPLEKGRAGEEAPSFVVEFVYLQRIAPWPRKGRARVDLPALDLPVSRTGVTLHHSPRFRVEPQPGTFHVESDPGPSAEAFRGAPVVRPPPAPAASPAPIAEQDAQRAALQALVDRFNDESGGRAAVGALPVRVTFPGFGPSVFLASELTAEGRSPQIDLGYTRAR
jgi:hypothetical protein